MPTPLLYRGLLYIVHHNARIAGPRRALGRPRLPGASSQRRGHDAPPPRSSANGRIYQGTEEGSLYVFAAGLEYRELAVHDLGAPLMATPAISEDTLLVRTPAELLAFRREPVAEQ